MIQEHSLSPEKLRAAADNEQAIKALLMSLPRECFPLVPLMQQGSMPGTGPVQVSVQSIVRQDNRLMVRTGVFFTSVIAGCNCSHDPSPVDEINEYGEVVFILDLYTGLVQSEITD